MKKYQFTIPKYGDLSADDAVVELERIRIKYGELTPDKVVEESRDNNAVLHNVFEWDDAKASSKWRNEQARQLIKNITVVVVNEDVTSTIRAIVSVSNCESDKRTYVPIEQALSDDKSYEDLLAQAKSDMESFVSKYSQIKELKHVRREMLYVLSEVKQN